MSQLIFEKAKKIVAGIWDDEFVISSFSSWQSSSEAQQLQNMKEALQWQDLIKNLSFQAQNQEMLRRFVAFMLISHWRFLLAKFDVSPFHHSFYQHLSELDPILNIIQMPQPLKLQLLQILQSWVKYNMCLLELCYKSFNFARLPSLFWVPNLKLYHLAYFWLQVYNPHPQPQTLELNQGKIKKRHEDPNKRKKKKKVAINTVFVI